MPESHLHALPAGHRVDDYEIVRVLGAGGFGITYLAYDHTLDGPVALKEYFPAGLAARTDARYVEPSSTGQGDEFRWGLERFLREARTLHRLRHPNVVRVFRFVEAHGTGYIVMEYVEGQSLAGVLERCGRLTAKQWRPWLDQLLNGLAHIHERGQLHRDIKPANIVIQKADQTAVLIDFGAARAAASNRTHTRILTPAYAPIEQHATGATVGPAADLYALAAVSYRALMGTPPAAAPDRMLDDEYEPLAERLDGADRNWLAAIDWALALRPDDRPPTVTVWRESTHVAGQFRLGTMYEKGRGVPQDYTQAAVWYRKAAKQGSVVAQLALGRMHLTGHGVSKDQTQAAAWCRKAAEQGNPWALYYLGRLYEHGIGVPRDGAQAVTWFRKAAEVHWPCAMYQLGLLYERGVHVPRDYARAAAWYRKAAERHCADAQFRLGWLYERGAGIPQDQQQAADWYRKATGKEDEQGHVFAQFRLARLCEHGEGVPQDHKQAAVWYRKAAGQGLVLAQTSLDQLDDDRTDVAMDRYGKVVAWCHEAAQEGNADAQYSLGLLYEHGQGVGIDHTQAAEWFRRAAQQGHVEAQYRLGSMHDDEDVVAAPDPVQAAIWLRKAAEQGHAEAQYRLGEMYTDGMGVPLDFTKAKAWLERAEDQGHVSAYAELWLIANDEEL